MSFLLSTSHRESANDGEGVDVDPRASGGWVARAQHGHRDRVNTWAETVHGEHDLGRLQRGCVKVHLLSGTAVDRYGGFTAVRAERGDPGSISAYGECRLVQGRLAAW